MCKHCNRSKGAGVGDTVPDYLRNNVNRARSWFDN
jgi:hypothetical protein